MDKVLAKRKVAETLESRFNKEKFAALVRELTNGYELRDSFVGNAQVKDKFREFVNSYERLGKYTDPKGKVIDILVVNLKKEPSLERARTAQRNFIAAYLKTRGEKDAAIVAFVAPDDSDWRFSFVKMEYKLEATDKGKLKAKEEFTPARRYSFLVGAQENSHTAQSRLLSLLSDDKHLPLLAELEDAFSIEKVTKEFFEKYRSLFLEVRDALDKLVSDNAKIKAEFEKCGIETADFAKKLLGQIVFLYFLQKKGWFGVGRDADWGTGPKDFLRELFTGEIKGYNNFFNEILEPLFYDALARERDSNFCDKLNCKIPFLNGGLFDPLNNYDWVHTDITLPNELFSNKDKTSEGDEGTGILDVFDRYNFTVKEDEPLEKEVAIDPEMLGKVFENLLEVKDRKSKGTYYTPREIVHYMCQQSLVYYLATESEGKVSKAEVETFIKYGESALEHDARVAAKGKETGDYSYKLPASIREHAGLLDAKLAEIKVCDPAVGSGAFLVGMMSEIVRARKTLNAYLGDKSARTPYEFKHHAIHGSLYGVDIDPSAVEIAKLRLWLSLVVDEDDIKHVKPLPNLDYKIMQGNSLLEEYEGIKLFDEKFILGAESEKEKTATLKAEQKEKSDEYLALHRAGNLSREKQAELDKELKRIESTLKKIESGKQKPEGPMMFDEMNVARRKVEELQKLHLEFFESSQKSQKDKIREQIDTLEWELIEATLKENGKADALKTLARYRQTNTKPFFLWKLHFSDVFRDKKGFDVVIANPPYIKEYVNRNAFDGLRESPYYQGKMDIWYLFACKGLDFLKPRTGVLTFIAQNNWVTSHGASKMRSKVIADAHILNLIDFGEYKVFETAGIQTMIMLFQSDSHTDNYSFDLRRLQNPNSVFADVVDILEKQQNPNAEYLNPQICRKDFSKGNLSFSNSAAEDVLKKIREQGNFTLTAKEVAQGIVYPQDKVIKATQQILREKFDIGDGIFLLTSEEKKSLSLTKQELELIKPAHTTKELFRYYGNPKNSEWVIYTDSSFKDPQTIKPYPNLKHHLDQFAEVITSDNKPYGLHRAREERFFKGEKIVALRKCAIPTFTYTDFDCYVSATFYVIKTDRVNQKFLTALLNSKLIAFWLKHKGKMQGHHYQLDKEPLVALPIKAPESAEQNTMAALLDKILQSKSKNPDADISALETQIDQQVYKLYNLNDSEITIIEESVR